MASKLMLRQYIDLSFHFLPSCRVVMYEESETG